jgi:hypothetical protein
MRRQNGALETIARLGAAHAAMRWSLDLFLRMVHQISTSFGGDLTSGIVFLAVVRANGQHLAEISQLDYSLSMAVIPDEARRPVSAKSISDSLDLPYETARRHLKRLCAKGYCQRVAEGYLIPQEVLERPDFTDVVARNFVNVQIMLSRARRAGLDVVPPPPG